MHYKMIFKTVFLFTLLSLFFIKSDAVAVMSIDLGSEWMKVAIVSPGVPMEIVLNKDSQRKTPAVVALRDGERFFGDLAVSLSVRFPEKVYSNLLDLLGKKLDSPIVELYRKRFPYYNITGDPERNTVVFNHPEGISFTPEEILAMLFKYAQEIASSSAGQPISDAVITVPPFFNQPERRALLLAAELAGIKALQILNTNTAIALHYGVFRRKDFNETPSTILFYDMGAGSTVASIVTYQLIKSKDRGFTETNPQLTIKGIGFDRTLGGLEVQFRLRDFLGNKFNEQKKTKNDVFKSHRALAKLLAEGGRLKKVLSANAEHISQVEGVLDEQDFRIPFSRVELEEICDDLLQRVAGPVEMALKMSGLSMDDVSQVILVGAGTRVPSVQQKLLDIVKKEELGKSVNTDEAAAMGAVYQAAYLSKGFKVKTFLIKDANIYPIQADFQRELTDGEKGVKLVRRTLFSRGNPIPQKKVITFTRHVQDFEFNINYGDLDFLSPLDLKCLGSFNISSIKLKGVGEALSKHSDDETEVKGVKAKFHMDENGLLSLDNVESVFEKKVDSEEKADDKMDLESTLAKLGSTIGKLFSSATDEADIVKDDNKKPQTPEEEVPSEEKIPDDKSKEKLPEEEKPQSSEDPKSTSNEEKSADEKKNDTVPPSGDKDKTSGVKQKVVLIKEPIEIDVIRLDLTDSSPERKLASKAKLKELDDQDKARLERDKARNALESFVIETKMKLHEKEFEAATSKEERENIMKQLGEAGDWLEYEATDAKTEVLKDKWADLRSLTRDMFERVREHRERPEALKALKDMLNLSDIFLTGAKNVSEEDQVFTEVEVTTLDKLIQDTKKWVQDSEKIQKSTALRETPKVTVKAIAEKIANLDREVKYLLNKARFAQPKKKAPPPAGQTVNDTKKTAEGKTDKTEESKEVPTTEDTKPEETLQIGDLPESESKTEAQDDGLKPDPSSPQSPQESSSHSEL